MAHPFATLRKGGVLQFLLEKHSFRLLSEIRLELVGAVGIELKATLRTRKLLIPLNAKNAKNIIFAEVRYTREFSSGQPQPPEPKAGSASCLTANILSVSQIRYTLLHLLCNARQAALSSRCGLHISADCLVNLRNDASITCNQMAVEETVWRKRGQLLQFFLASANVFCVGASGLHLIQHLWKLVLRGVDPRIQTRNGVVVLPLKVSNRLDFLVTVILIVLDGQNTILPAPRWNP